MTDATIDSTPAAPSPPSIFSRVMGDIFNPVLVKEIRQAQRGRVFAIALIVTVTLALLAALTMSVGIERRQGSRAGVEFFLAVYLCMCGAMVLVVPFQAFITMGAEWDDNTFEMLVLSNLKPRQIVLGKILAAMVQGLMFFAAFLPFVAVAFLLRGVDFTMLLLILGLTIFACLWLSTVAVMLSTVTRKRFLRVLMMVALAGGLVMLIGGAYSTAENLLRLTVSLSDPAFWVVLSQVLFGATMVGLFAFSAACNLLAHEEENRSSNVRILITVTVVSMLGILAYHANSTTLPVRAEIVNAMAIFMIFAVSAFSVFFCCEPERLGRRVEPSVPKRGGLALITLPWYPGGGRGIVFLLFHLALICSGALVLVSYFDIKPFSSAFAPMSAPSTASGSLMAGGGLSVLLSILYALLYTVVPIGFLHGFATTPVKRNLLRGFALLSPLLFGLLPAVIGVFFDDRSMQSGRHIGNPERLIGRSWDGRISEPGYVVLLIPLILAGLLTNFFRVSRAISETRKASASNRSKQGEESSAAPPAVEAS